MAKKDPKCPHQIVQYLAMSMEPDEGFGCRIGQAFMDVTDRLVR